MTRALVIPVRNDAAALATLLQQALGLGLFDQIVVVDDGSDIPVSAPEQVQIIRHVTSLGAGAARNAGLDAVSCDHVIFFDSDDLFAADFGALCADLQREQVPFDFCLFRHNDSRMAARGRWGQMPLDNALWRQANAANGAHGALWTARDTAALAQTANYPWNKIYRTQFLRDHGLRFSHDRVHNDITLHWLGFAAAERVLASDRICAHHVVTTCGARLTNETGRARLGVFAPLRVAAVGLRDHVVLWPAFLRFAAGLLDWVRDVLHVSLQNDLDQATGQFWRAHLDSDTLDTLNRTDPVLALRLVLQMAGGRVPC